MKDKERLLSFDCKIRFIFSHSALREGWDNPNVFQICTLNETKSTIKKRQEIGRGLRLCVNQTGERQHDAGVNILTVMANESYDEFADTLQREYEADGIRFCILEVANFANIRVKDNKDDWHYFGTETARKIIDYLEEKGYIDEKGNVQDNLKNDIQRDIFEVSEELKPYEEQIQEICLRASSKIPIRDKRERREVQLNKVVYLSPEFKEVWDRIKWKTTYRVDFSTDELIKQCRKRIALELQVPSPKIIQTRADVQISTGGVISEVKTIRPVDSYKYSGALPDIVNYLQNATNLTRRTIIEILTGKKKTSSGELESFDNYGNRLEDFKKNPQFFMEEVAKIFRSVMKSLIVDGIRYQKIGDTEYYSQELFETEEIKGYLESNMMASKKGVYNYVIYDSENERKIAASFEQNEDVLLYAKLPAWFKINTPLGTYNPDWVLMVQENDEKKLYFVLETKGNIDVDALRPTELSKIKCGKEHFKALETGVKFEPVKDFDEFMQKI